MYIIIIISLLLFSFFYKYENFKCFDKKNDDKNCPKQDSKYIPACPKNTIECGNIKGYCFDPYFDDEKQEHEKGRMISTFFVPGSDSCGKHFSGDPYFYYNNVKVWERQRYRDHKKCDYLKNTKPKLITVFDDQWFPDFQWKNTKFGLFGKNVIWKNIVDNLINKKINSSVELVISNPKLDNPISFIGIKLKDKIKIYPKNDFGLIRQNEYIYINDNYEKID